MVTLVALGSLAVLLAVAENWWKRRKIKADLLFGDTTSPGSNSNPNPYDQHAGHHGGLGGHDGGFGGHDGGGGHGGH